MANTMEHRKMERFPIQLPTRLLPVDDAEEQEAIEVLTSDVCAGGAFFQTDQPLPLGAEVKVKMVLPLDELKKLEGKKAFIEVSGAVIRSTETGMAICFDKNYKMSSLRE